MPTIELLKPVLDDGPGSSAVKERLLRPYLRQRFTATFADAADLAAFSTVDCDSILVGGRLYRNVASGTVDGVRILADGDGRLYQATSRKLISEQTISSAVASVIFTGLDAESDLELWLNKAGGDSTSQLRLMLQVSADGGGSWATTGYQGVGDTIQNATSPSMAGITAGIPLGGSVSSGVTNHQWSGRVSLWGFGLSGYRTAAEAILMTNQPAFRSHVSCGWFDTARADNALRILWDTGNIDEGTFSLWRIN